MTYVLFNLKKRETDSLNKEEEKHDVRDRMRATVSCVYAERAK